ncbi:MAG: hypothetical protein BWX70_03498 [Verrucomicrobia bacterium ADurb.Bin070]|nr:MAG: hypothetical protein BWX70_03498 [Verrucomicrobia bacterium ADurb.Bin070]
MKYWEEYRSKWGFGDGDAVPPDAWALRYVYVREINRLAQAKGSAVRLIAYDRGGVHNPYLICSVPADAVKGVPEPDLCKGAWAGGWKPERDWAEPADDDAMLEAVEEALANDDIDGLVDVDVSIADEPGVDCNIAA